MFRGITGSAAANECHHFDDVPRLQHMLAMPGAGNDFTIHFRGEIARIELHGLQKFTDGDSVGEIARFAIDRQSHRTVTSTGRESVSIVEVES